MLRLSPLLVVLAMGSGCVERLISIKSDPEGAAVTLDGKRVGTTPCDVPFNWYGGREILVEKEGYTPQLHLEEVNTPWWQYPGLDFLTDVVLPFTLTDRRDFSYTLEKTSGDIKEFEEVKKRAEELRRKARESPQ